MSHQDRPFSVRRSLSSSLTAYHDFIQEILDRLEAFGWKKSDLFAIHMALEESISNAIRHGNREDATKHVEVECQLEAHRFWAKVCDEGEGYDPACVPDCCAEENLEASGGRGLALIRAYMTSVEHRQNGRCLIMEKRISPEDPSRS